MSFQTIEQIFENNITWANKKKEEDPNYFSDLAKMQKPPYLWIGCSDSRVPPNTVTGTDPGEIFIHRNIANVVVNTDLNLLSVLEYAVVHLGVQHVIVAGHYNCGGVKAAMSNQSFGMLDSWLSNIKTVYRLHEQELDAIENLDARADRFAELNVQEQVTNLANTNIIQNAWKEGKQIQVHGWVYDLYNGLLKPISKLDNSSDVSKIYAFENL